MRTPRPDSGNHQCWTSPSTNCRAAARSRCARARFRPRYAQRHHVLQLIAETIGAACLVEGRPRPYAAGQRLIGQPAVEEDIHRPVRRLDLHGPGDVVPLLGHRGEDRVEVGLAVLCDKRLRLGARSPTARGRRRSPLCPPRLSVTRVCSAPHGSRPAPTRLENARPAPTQAADPSRRHARGIRSGRRSTPFAFHSGRRRPRDRQTASLHGFRAKIAPVSGSISVTTKGAVVERFGRGPIRRMQ